jgi:prevent-host-death family protein
MSEEIGVRQLRDHATSVVRAVREEQAEYIITVHGKPVAVLRPYTPADEVRQREEAATAFMAELDALSEQVSRAWRSDQSAVEAVRDQRR